jgi:hypothetical protein
MDFDQQLKKAIARGSRSRETRDQAALSAALTAEELRDLHARYRLDLSESIEDRLRKLADHFPGFEFETVLGSDGWGARITRDDLKLAPKRQVASLYSRLEMIVTPKGEVPIIELVAKATIGNKEAFNRRHYQPLQDADLTGFEALINQWSVEYAELYAAQRV